MAKVHRIGKWAYLRRKRPRPLKTAVDVALEELAEMSPSQIPRPYPTTFPGHAFRETERDRRRERFPRR
jgi:hypothetical protein